MNPDNAALLPQEKAYLQRLLDAFGGSIEGWEWTGQILEQDPRSSTAIPCACGHKRLRYLFPWRKDPARWRGLLPSDLLDDEKEAEQVDRQRKRLVYTGSVCVETVPGISPELLESFADEIKAARRREKEAKSAALAHRISLDYDALRADIVKVEWIFDALRNRHGNLPEGFGGRNARLVILSEKLASARKLKTVRGRKARLCQLREAFDRDFGSELQKETTP